MKLPYEFEYDGQRIADFEVQELSAAGIAEAQKMTRKGAYQGMRKMSEYVCFSLNGNEDRTFICNAIQSMPFYSLYTMLVHGLALTHGQDFVEGAYTCPKCRTIRYYDRSGDMDDSDKLDDFIVEPAEGLDIEFQLPAPVRLASKSMRGDDTEMEVSAICMRWPTVMDFIRGESAHPDDSTRCLFRAYSEALLTVDGQKVDQKWRTMFGELVFAKMSIVTLNKISAALSEKNIGHGTERTCLHCRHTWKTDLDLSLFFDFDR